MPVDLQVAMRDMRDNKCRTLNLQSYAQVGKYILTHEAWLRGCYGDSALVSCVAKDKQRQLGAAQNRDIGLGGVGSPGRTDGNLKIKNV